MNSIFDEEEELRFVYKHGMVSMILQQVPQKTVVIQVSGPRDVFTVDDILKTPTYETLWGGRSTLPMTDRDRRMLKLRAMRGVMY